MAHCSSAKYNISTSPTVSLAQLQFIACILGVWDDVLCTKAHVLCVIALLHISHNLFV